MLCEICSGLDLTSDDFIIRLEEDVKKFDEYYDIGSLHKIRQRAKYCALCRLVDDVTSRPEREPQSNVKEEDIKCQFYWQSDGFIYGVEEPTVRRLRIRATPWPSFWPEFNSITILSDVAPNGCQLFLGRKILDQRIDFKLIKKWLQKCQKWHGDECDSNLKEDGKLGLPSVFRIIDTWAMCIDELPNGSKFSTLSYVWGRIDVFKLTTTNVADLQKPGGLKKVWHLLPTTIRDAISLTSSLSIRYVWIDSLCILQDDVADKMKLIPAMDLIYDHAFLTIVAATGSDANAGLSGVRRNSRGRSQMVEEVMPGLHMISLKHITDCVDQSVWESRGWTYQERLFSRRCLIFTNGQVIFRCNEVCWREDIHLEDDDIESSFDMTFKHSIKRGNIEPEDSHGDYVGALYEYTHRQLGYDSDILNAFSGVLSVLVGRMTNGRSSTISHIYGLPSFLFDWAILWQPNKLITRRLGGWPSWSWCGWIGGIAMALTNFSTTDKLENWLRQYTWIEWTFFDYKGRKEMQIPSTDIYQRENTRFPLEARNPVRDLDRSQPWLGNVAISRIHKILPTPEVTNYSPLIHLTTLIIDLNLTPSDIHIGTDRSYIILDPSGAECGTIWIEDEFAINVARPHEFLIMSHALRNSVVSKKEFKPVSSGGEWDAYHVMLVNRIHDGEICERVALGRIYSEAIEQRSGGDSHGILAEWKGIWLL